MDWAPVATAPDEMTADMWVELLRNNSIPAFSSRGDALASRLVPFAPTTVTVSASQLEEARRILGPTAPRRRRRAPRKFFRRDDT